MKELKTVKITHRNVFLSLLDTSFSWDKSRPPTIARQLLVMERWEAEDKGSFNFPLMQVARITECGTCSSGFALLIVLFRDSDQAKIVFSLESNSLSVSLPRVFVYRCIIVDLGFKFQLCHLKVVQH